MTPARRGIDKSVHSRDQAAFCELMAGARKAAGLTHALADRLKKLQSFVAKYEGGERRLDVVEFVAIARAIGADPLKLMATFGGAERPNWNVRRGPSVSEILKPSGVKSPITRCPGRGEMRHKIARDWLDFWSEQSVCGGALWEAPWTAPRSSQQSRP